MELTLKWKGKVADAQPNNIFLNTEQDGFGRIKLVSKDIKHNFKVNDTVLLSLEKVSEPPPLNVIRKNSIVIYGTLKEYIVNGMILIKWSKDGWIKSAFVWEELVVIIDEYVLADSPFDQGSCIRFRMEKLLKVKTY